VSTLGELAHAADAARVAAAAIARRPRREVAAALGRAAARWRRDPALSALLPGEARLSPPLVSATVDIVAEAFDVDAMLDLVERELGSERSVRPWLVAHVLASNVPALAVHTIALACLAGAAVLVKSGRADRISAPAFRRALEAEDADLATTVVATSWTGGDVRAERALLAHADVVVATGRDETIAAIAGRVKTRFVVHGERASVAVVGRDESRNAGALMHSVARDVALHDQRGCLSPVVVYVEGDVRAVASELAAALETVGTELPPGPLEPAERAAHRAAVAEAEWAGATVLPGVHGTVLIDDASPRFRPSPGRRTVWVLPLASLDEALLAGRIECVGLAGVATDVGTLRRLGVSRVCAPGRMQRPLLSWPRGQLAPLRTLLALPAEPRLEVEPA
jgi:acyl-CoA reductase-like NAD-dependent aldehyde dehydrogenase